MDEGPRRSAPADRAGGPGDVGLSRCVHPTVGRRRWNAYFVCGFAGYLAGVALVTALAFRLELDVTVRAMLVLIPPLTMLVVDHRCRRRARGRMLVVTRPGRRIDARAVTRAAAQLGHPWASCEVVPGKTAGLFHLRLSVEG